MSIHISLGRPERKRHATGACSDCLARVYTRSTVRMTSRVSGGKKKKFEEPVNGLIARTIVDWREGVPDEPMPMSGSEGYGDTL